AGDARVGLLAGLGEGVGLDRAVGVVLGVHDLGEVQLGDVGEIGDLQQQVGDVEELGGGVAADGVGGGDGDDAVGHGQVGLDGRVVADGVEDLLEDDGGGAVGAGVGEGEVDGGAGVDPDGLEAVPVGDDVDLGGGGDVLEDAGEG